MDWKHKLSLMDCEALQDLCCYLYDSDRYATQDKEALIDVLLHGKLRQLFYLMDKSAFKTLKRLVRHPDRTVTLSIYPVEQLLQLHLIEEIPMLIEEPDTGWYRIREEAQELAVRLERSRHFDHMMNRMIRMDELLLGIFHTFGVLELHQCQAILQMYDIDIRPQRLFSMMNWRLPIRDELMSFQITGKKQSLSFIMLRGLDFQKVTKGLRRFPEYTYELCDEMEMRRRKDRYFQKDLPEFEVLNAQLRKHFSRHFVADNTIEMIEAYQYHTTHHKKEHMILRVFEETKMRPYLEAVKAALLDVYRKGHAAWNPSK